MKSEIKEPIEFIKYLKQYIPTHSKIDEGINFNLTQVHIMINIYLEDYKRIKSEGESSDSSYKKD